VIGTHLAHDQVAPVLVAGATGFIGRRLVALLRRSGVDVRTVRGRECDLRRLDSVRAVLRAHRPRTIVNLARPTRAADRRPEHAGHLEIAANLLTAGRSAGVHRLIQLGSATEFGDAESPVDDDVPPDPTTPFGRAKAAATSIVRSADDDGIRTAVLRPFSVYGPGDLRQHLIPAAIDAAHSGGRLPLACGAERDWVFVDDVAVGCALALDGRVDGLAVNLASGVAIPNERVVELVEEHTGRQIEVDPAGLRPRPWDAGIAGATERARRILGWEARIRLSEGIRLTAAAFDRGSVGSTRAAIG
jgi:nucleoside-diphosphate-sugar epimerase